MLSVGKKYFIRQFLWGLTFILIGINLMISSESLIWSIGALICIILFVVVCIGNIYLWKKKTEPEDELVIQNRRKAECVVFEFVTFIILIYAIIGKSFHFEITKYIAYIVYGTLQIIEYVFFLFFQRQ